MATATHPTSIRLTPAEKRHIAAAARKRGLSPAAYIKRAALAGPASSDIAKLSRLEKLTFAVLEAVEDELDYRVAVSRWDNHVKNKTRLYTGEEVKRELGLPA